MSPAVQFDGLQQYASDGVFVMRQIFPASLIDQLKAGWQAVKRRIAAGEIARNARFVSGSLPDPIETLYRNERLVDVAQTILGTASIALYMNRLLLKDEEWSGAVAIHQDMPYFSGGLHKLSIFVPLTPTSARNGGLIFLKGSHKFGNLQRGTIRREAFPPMDEIAPDLEVGDVILMNFLAWHYSEEAAIPGDRPLLQITYQPSSDGSYGSGKLGVARPTLVSGEWMTEHFAAWGESTTPDA
jgi:ectoine hydroxylase-related dioxygenase (phytanoyl-CoA dioxygenase family)